jgi:exosortase
MRQRPQLTAWAAALTLLFLWAYWPTLGRILSTWQSNPDYTHGLLVVPIAIAVWLRRRGGAAPVELSPSVGGLFLIAFACLFRMIAAQYYLLPLDSWSIPIWLAGVIWTFGGWRQLKTAWPAVAFLWFAMPLPDRAQELLSLPLQQRATAGSAWILQSLGQPAAAAGTTLLLGDEVFEVERACSGLRMFFGSLAMAVAFVLLSPMARWNKLALLALVPPIALLANIVRIVLTVLLFRYVSTEISRRFVHDFAGLTMVGLVCVLFAASVWLMRAATRAHARDHERFVKRLPLWPIGVALAIFGAVLWHQRQQSRVHGALLAAATRYEQAEDWPTAAGYLRSYLRFQRDDTHAYARLALAMNQAARDTSEKRRALTVLTAAWKANPDDLRLALEQAKLAFELRQYSQVIDTAAGILNHPEIEKSENAEARSLAARWRAAAMYDVLSSTDAFAPFGWKDVADALDAARKLDSNYPQHALRLGLVLRERLRSPAEAERIQLADRALDEAVQANVDSAEAWLARYRYRQQFVRREEATPELLAAMDADLLQAVRLDADDNPRNVHILVAAAERERGRGNLDPSLAYYQEALKANPQDVRPYLAISEIQVERGLTEGRRQAVEVLQRGLEVIGANEVPLMFPLIEHLVILQREEEADSYQQLARERLELYPEPVRSNYRVQLEQVAAWRLARQGGYEQAAKLLVTLLKTLPNSYLQAESSYVAQSWATAGQYCRMNDDWDGAVQMYQQAASLDNAWALEYRWTVAKRTEFQGNFGEASEQFRQLAAASDGSLEAWLNATYAELRQQLLLPTMLRDWTRFRRSLESARAVAGDRQEQVLLLEANHYLVLGQTERVVKMLRDGAQQYPQSTILHRALALVLARIGEVDEALEVARRLPPSDNASHINREGGSNDGGDDSSDGDNDLSLLLQHEILTLADRREEALTLLDAAIAKRPDAIAVELLLESARLHMQQGSWDDARARLKRASEQDETDLRVAELTSQLAWCLKDWELLETCEQMLRSAEGDVGPMWRTFRIRRLLAQSSNESETGSSVETEVNELTQQLEMLYPNLPETRVAAGRVASFRGLLWQAVANYEEAWEMGLPNVPLAVDLISLLNELGEVERAQKYVGQIRQYLSARSSLIDDSMLGMSDESAESAIRLAEALVQENPNSETFLRLGRTLVLTALPGRRDYGARLTRAENAFRRATETTPSDPRTWAALFRYLVSVKSDLVQSHQVLQTIQDHPEITPLNRTFVLAQLQESIGNDAAAEPLYRSAITAVQSEAPPLDKLIVLERAAQYFRQRDPKLAETCCQQALQIDERAIGARRILLELLLDQRTVESNQRARALIGDQELRWIEGDRRLRLEARTLLQAVQLQAQGTDGSWRQAIDLLGQISTRTSEDGLMLAELYLYKQQLGDAIAELQRVADDLPQDGTALLSFLKRWDHVLFSDTRLRLLAERIYDRLEENTVFDLTSLDVRVDTMLERTGGRSETLTDGRVADAGRPGTGAGEQQAAMSLISRFARRSVARAANEQAQFQATVRLMQHLIQTNRWEDAERLAHLTPDLLAPPKTAAALATALAMTPLPAEEIAHHLDQLTVWRGRYSQDAPLVFALGNLYLISGEYDKAAEAYRRCHELAPSHAMTLNNLAIAELALDPAAMTQPQTLVETALTLDGAKPQIVDTLALIRLHQDRPEEAVRLWLDILPSAGGDPVLLLHLAQGWDRLDDAPMAQFALRLAMSRGVERMPLTAMDRAMLTAMNLKFSAVDDK